MLKTYESEGWVGGKISYAEIPKETATPPIVVRYVEDLPKIERKNDDAAQPEDAAKVLDKIEEELKSITPSSKPAEGKFLKKATKRRNEEEETELTKVIREAMGEEDLYFEDSNFLE